MDLNLDFIFLGNPHRLFDLSIHVRMMSLALQAHRLGQVEVAESSPIQPRRGKDLLYIFKTFQGLDDDPHHYVLVGPFHMMFPVVEPMGGGSGTRARASISQGSIAGGFRDLSNLFGIRNARNQYSDRSGVENF